MKAASLYRGQSFASQSPPLSYANTVRAGSNSSGSGRVSKSVSFSDNTPSTQSSTRSIPKRANEQGIEGGAIVVDLQGSEQADTEQARRKFTEVLQAVEDLHKVDVED